MSARPPCDARRRKKSDEQRHACVADIDARINLVPPKFYFPPDPDEVAKNYQKYTR